MFAKFVSFSTLSFLGFGSSLLVTCASRVGAQISLSEASFTEAVHCNPILSNVPGALPTLIDKPDERGT